VELGYTRVVRTYTTPFGLIRNFESQFERDGTGGYLYRLEGRGKPSPVGAGERQRFVSQYASRIFLLWGAMMLAVRKWRFERLRPGSNGLAFAPPALRPFAWSPET
jgi:hypothetical protein